MIIDFMMFLVLIVVGLLNLWRALETNALFNKLVSLTAFIFAVFYVVAFSQSASHNIIWP